MKEISIMIQDGKVIEIHGLPRDYGYSVIEFTKVDEENEAKPDLTRTNWANL